MNSRAAVSIKAISMLLRVSRRRQRRLKRLWGRSVCLSGKLGEDPSVNTWVLEVTLLCLRRGPESSFCFCATASPRYLTLQERHSWKLQAPLPVVPSPPQLAPSYLLFFVVKSSSC